MKRSPFLMLVFLMLGECMCVYAQVFKNEELSVTKLEENMWVIETTGNTCIYIIEGLEKAVLVGTGTKGANLNPVVRLITQKPLYVVLTHMHADHAGNYGSV